MIEISGIPKANIVDPALLASKFVRVIGMGCGSEEIEA